MLNESLFDLPDPEPKRKRSAKGSRGAARVRKVDRHQMRLLPTNLDALLPEDHQARAVWAYVEQLDLTTLYAPIQAVEGSAGRPATDPQILLALWLYATIDGVGSARALERLCQHHSAYRWICGGVGVVHSTLSVFRTGHAAALDELLTQSVALLRHKGLVDLKRIAQDGMRVRASAGAASFRRAKSLKKCLRAAKKRVARLREEVDQDACATSKRQQAAKESAARRRAARVAEAVQLLPKLQAKRPRAKREDTRVSTTDPDARVMKMPDGGFRPAFNVQFAADTKSQVVVGVDVTNKGSDLGELSPMLDQVKERHGVSPDEALVDGGFVRLKDIEAAADDPHSCKVYAPVPRHKKTLKSPSGPCRKDAPAVAEWRKRMGTDDAKEIYKERGATVECVNAIARNRGLRQFKVRGLKAAKSVALLFALAHNVARAITLLA